MKEGGGPPTPSGYKAGFYESETMSGGLLSRNPIYGQTVIPLAIGVTAAGPLPTREENLFANSEQVKSLFYSGKWGFIRFYPNMDMKFKIQSEAWASSVRQNYYGSNFYLDSADFSQISETMAVMTCTIYLSRTYGGDSVLRGKWSRYYVPEEDWTWDAADGCWEAPLAASLFSDNRLRNTDWTIGQPGISSPDDSVTVELRGTDGNDNRAMVSKIQLRSLGDGRDPIEGFKAWGEQACVADATGTAVDLSELLAPTPNETHDSVYLKTITDFIDAPAFRQDAFLRNDFKPDAMSTNCRIRVFGYDPRDAAGELRLYTRKRII